MAQCMVDLENTVIEDRCNSPVADGAPESGSGGRSPSSRMASMRSARAAPPAPRAAVAAIAFTSAITSAVSTSARTSPAAWARAMSCAPAASIRSQVVARPGPVQTRLAVTVPASPAMHCILRLRGDGYRVRGTVRNAQRGARVSDVLAKHADVSRLSLVEANLSGDSGWEQAVDGCARVLHVASPVPRHRGSLHASGKLEVARAWLDRTGLDATGMLLVGDTNHGYEVATGVGASCVLVADGHQDDVRLRACDRPVVSELAELYSADTLLRALLG